MKGSNKRLHTDGNNVGTTERVLSTAAGAVLTAYGARERDVLGGLSALVGGLFLFRGLSGHCPLFARLGLSTADGGQAQPIHIEQSVTIERATEEVYDFWRDLENLPRFMRHLTSVTVDEETGRSRWTAELPDNLGRLEWTAERTADEPGRRISWRTLPGGDVFHSGTVQFEEAPGDRGTEVHVRIDYRPPAGPVGRSLAAFLNPGTAQLIKEDIRRFKALMETGEVPTIEGQPSGRKRQHAG